MKERINRLAKGIIDSEFPKIVWSPDTIEETIRINTIARREIFVGSENGLNVKGLIYSSNARIRIPHDNNAFGGLRNHIVYEVDTSFLSSGDEIRGSFYLVTNCGEKEIPYIFHLDLAASGKLLGELNTVEDFLRIAEHDMDTALRLLEYQDFTEAPFMQDMHIRAIYDGLKSHGSRQNFMEEFLVALGVKNPIRLMIEKDKRVYEDPVGHMEDFITVRTDTWGYLYMELSADGDFIHLPKKSATQVDFTDGVFKIPFNILSERLHSGRNFGVIIITTTRSVTRIPIEVSVEGEERDSEETSFKEEMGHYLELRLDYDSGTYEDALILNQMQRGLDLMKMTYDDPILLLLQAEIYIQTGRNDKANQILDEYKEKKSVDNRERKELHCFYEYLQLLISDNPEQKDSLIRLLQKSCSAGNHSNSDFMLYLLHLRINKGLFDNPTTVLISMEQEFKDGCHSPFLYMECLKLLEKSPDLLRNFGGLEAQTLYFGAKRGILGKELAILAAKAINHTKTFKKMYLRLLWAIYEKYPEVEVLTFICTMMIRGDCRDSSFFLWYEKGVKEEVSLTRLNEYYLYSLPEDYHKLLPKQILLYFSYVSELDYNSRSVLYENILTYENKDSDIYKLYERDIEKFAMEQLFAGRINRRLAVIYKHMLYKELIDPQIAKTLPSILKSNRIVCHDDSMRYVIVRHEELTTEDAYPLQSQIAYVPLFSERDVIQFQDTYGNRYMNIKYDKLPAMEHVDGLLEQCFSVYPEYPMLFVNACYDVMEKDQMTESDALLLERADEKMNLHPLFRKKLTLAMVHFYKQRADANSEDERSESMVYLLSVNKDYLSAKERSGVCETLIRQNYYTEAYNMICRYGAEEISTKQLLKLCTKMVLQKLFDEDDELLHMTYRVFSESKNDSVILDYLCEHFNGTVDQMYGVLIQAIKEHVETYDLEERLLAQMLFTGDTERMDKVFDLYASRKKTNESIVKAYFTIKSMEYFMDEKTTEDKVFAYLEGAVNGSSDKDKVADIYLLALTKYYSTLPELTDEQKNLCQTVVDVLIEAGMIFSYFKELAKFIIIPGNILDKEIIEYHGKKDVKPYLQLRILPEEEEFHFEEMRPIYKGIYIREKVLFEGEIMEYRIEEETGGKTVIRSEGSVSCKEIVTRAPGNRFACLNEMSLSLDVKNENALLEKMEEYLEQDAVVNTLFTLQ
ncbi:MAG: DUF5717 family protein [Clostridium sp.]